MTTKTELRTRLETIIWFFEDDYAEGESARKDKDVANTVDKLLTLLEDTVREAREDELNLLVHATANRLKGETWKDWGWRVHGYLVERLVELKEQGRASVRQAKPSPNTKLNNGGQ